MICPRCSLSLQKTFIDRSYVWLCPICSGRAVALPVVRNLIPVSAFRELWEQGNSAPASLDVSCPVCRQNMRELTVGNQKIDLCQSCQFLWFDHNEFEELPEVSSPAVDGELPLEVRNVIAISKLVSVKSQQEIENIEVSPPDHWWELVLGFLGFPVEYNTTTITNIPVVTWLLSALIAIITILSLGNLDDVVKAWGLLPGDLTRHAGLTFISSFFLHGGIIHLLGNLYFLFVFGDNAEDVLGPVRFLLLITLAALVGDVAHVAADPRATVPSIGASGGISGVLTYYALRFPRAKVGFLWWLRWFRVPIGWMLVFWVLGQMLGAVKQIAGFGHVSSLAHLGGAFVGMLFWWHFDSANRDGELARSTGSCGQ